MIESIVIGISLSILGALIGTLLAISIVLTYSKYGGQR